LNDIGRNFLLGNRKKFLPISFKIQLLETSSQKYKEKRLLLAAPPMGRGHDA
jgi:hypothetical protein